MKIGMLIELLQTVRLQNGEDVEVCASLFDRSYGDEGVDIRGPVKGIEFRRGDTFVDLTGEAE